MQQHKIEILLPLNYNNKKPVEGKKFVDTYKEIFNYFGGCTKDNTPLLGGWGDPKTNKKYSDTNICYWVIYNDSDNNINFLRVKREIKE